MSEKPRTWTLHRDVHERVWEAELPEIDYAKRPENAEAIELEPVLDLLERTVLRWRKAILSPGDIAVIQDLEIVLREHGRLK